LATTSEAWMTSTMPAPSFPQRCGGIAGLIDRASRARDSAPAASHFLSDLIYARCATRARQILLRATLQDAAGQLADLIAWANLCARQGPLDSAACDLHSARRRADPAARSARIAWLDGTAADEPADIAARS